MIGKVERLSSMATYVTLTEAASYLGVSKATAIRFACSSKGIVFGEPFGNHSKFQVVIRMIAPLPTDKASEANETVNAATSKSVRAAFILDMLGSF
jgi:hypothetical protein